MTYTVSTTTTPILTSISMTTFVLFATPCRCHDKLCMALDCVDRHNRHQGWLICQLFHRDQLCFPLMYHCHESAWGCYDCCLDLWESHLWNNSYDYSTFVHRFNMLDFVYTICIIYKLVDIIKQSSLVMCSNVNGMLIYAISILRCDELLNQLI